MFRRQLVLPRARRAARQPAPGTSPAGADRGPAGTPGPRGRAGRVVPGATQAPSLGGSPSPIERGKGRPGARPRPGATAMPGKAQDACRLRRLKAEEAGAKSSGVTRALRSRRKVCRPPAGSGESLAARRSDLQACGRSRSMRRLRGQSRATLAVSDDQMRHPSRWGRTDSAAGSRARTSSVSGSARRRLLAQLNMGNVAEVRRLDFVNTVTPPPGGGAAAGEARGQTRKNAERSWSAASAATAPAAAAARRRACLSRSRPGTRAAGRWEEETTKRNATATATIILAQ